MNQALAHPLGANFKEFISIIEIKKERLACKIKSMFTNVGLDSIGTHYGQNIFDSDYNASTGGQHSFGNFNGQGVKTTIFSFHTEVSYRINWFDIFVSVAFKKKQSELLNQTALFYSLGIRTFPFLYFKDY